MGAETGMQGVEARTQGLGLGHWALQLVRWALRPVRWVLRLVHGVGVCGWHLRPDEGCLVLGLGVERQSTCWVLLDAGWRLSSLVRGRRGSYNGR